MVQRTFYISINRYIFNTESSLIAALSTAPLKTILQKTTLTVYLYQYVYFIHFNVHHVLEARFLSHFHFIYQTAYQFSLLTNFGHCKSAFTSSLLEET